MRPNYKEIAAEISTIALPKAAALAKLTTNERKLLGLE